MTNLPNWTQAVTLHPDVASGSTAISLYAIDLGSLVSTKANIPVVYRNARNFFAATHLTTGLKQLLEDVLKRLSGIPGDRVLQLHSPFGGGKTHSLVSLYYAATDYPALSTLSGGDTLPDPGTVRVAVVDGEKFDIQGKTVNGQVVCTLWGNIAAQLGCYSLVEYHDRNRVAPGGDVIQEMLGDQPTLILLDEVLKYIERASAESVGDSTLGRQSQDFLQSLSVEVAGSVKAVLIYSLQASLNEAFGNTQLLNMLDHLTSRVDAKREPVTMKDTLPVLRKRLLEDEPDGAITHQVAAEYAKIVTKMRSANAANEAERRIADHGRMGLQDQFSTAYPFHPELINLMRERWSSLPNFQRTRGALRFLAVCLYTLHQKHQARSLLSPGDIPLDDLDVQQAFFSEVGQRASFQAVLERDFYGPNARIQQIDERIATENPALTGVNPAMRLATAILMYSFGGLTKVDPDSSEPFATGVTESELIAAVISPALDNLTAQAVLGQLRNQCLYLHYDGAHYAFKTTPNVTQVLEDYATRVSIERDVDPAIQSELTTRLGGRQAIVWPSSSQNIPHQEPRFLLAYLPLEFAYRTPAQQLLIAQEYLTHYGEHLRRFRNGLGLAIPTGKAVAYLRDAQKYLLAIEQINRERHSLQLTSAQLAQLKERQQHETSALESAFRNLYEAVWLPKLVAQEIIIEKVELSGRALSAANIHERLIELLKIAPPHLFDTVTPEKIMDLMQLGMGEVARNGLPISEIVQAFFENLDFPRMENSAAVGVAVAQGVQSGLFGYVGRSAMVDISQLRDSSGYYIDRDLVRIGMHLDESEIDMSSAMIVLPQVIQPVVLVEPGDTQVSEQITTEIDQPGTDSSEQITTPQTQSKIRTHVRLSMEMTRQQIYASTNALSNLAQAAGKIKILVEATKVDGFDPTWLQNAVLEPLDEADIEVEEE